jgi:hypothetical protein
MAGQPKGDIFAPFFDNWPEIIQDNAIRILKRLQ